MILVHVANDLNFLCIRYKTADINISFKRLPKNFRKRKDKKKDLFHGLITNGSRYFKYSVNFPLNIIKLVISFKLFSQMN